MISHSSEAFGLADELVDMADNASLSVGTLRAAILGPWVAASQLLSQQVSDPTKPYGRHVLVDGAHLEVMLATWTRGIFCAPHDHGGSQGVVRVLQGRALHRIYRVESGQLQMVREERAQAGELLTCGRDLVHSMGDDGGELPLVTLHMYTDPVPHMVVYDEAANRTLKVDGRSGAWVPASDSEHLLGHREGMIAPHEMR